MKRSLAVFSILLLTSGLAHSQNRLNIKQGQVISTNLTSKQTMDMGAGMQMASDVNSTYEVSTSDLAGDSAFNLYLTFKSAKATAEGMGQNQSYDSNTGEGKDSEIGAVFHKKIGQTDTLMVNRITTKRILSKEDSASSNPMAMLNNNGADVSGLIENIFFLLPANAKAGEKWEVKSKTNGIDSETKYELKTVEGNIGKIGDKTRVDGTTEMEVQGMPVSVSTKGKMDGNFDLEISSGLIRRKSIESDLSSSMEIMGQQMEMQVKGTTTVTNTLK